MIYSLVRELKNATDDDQAAKREALEMGLMATKPFTAIRLQQLCALGERMMDAAARKERAETALAHS